MCIVILFVLIYNINRYSLQISKYNQHRKYHKGGKLIIMKKFHGTALGGGSAAGKLYILRHDQCPVRRYHIENSSEEIKRFEDARSIARDELLRLFKKTAREINEYEARIFSTQKIMLFDPSFTDSVYDIISDQMINAETAVAQTSEKLMQIVSEADDGYISSRSYDIRDISERVIRILLGIHNSEILSNEPVIIAAHDLPPSDIVRFEREMILGIALEEGSENSHASLLARSFGFPAVIRTGAMLDDLIHGSHAIIDGDNGVIITEPDTQTKTSYKHIY